MITNHVKVKLREGKAVAGTWLNLGDPIAAEAIAALGFDWLVVDTEHSPIGLDAMAHMFQAIGRFPTAPMARIPWNSEEHIKRVLDAGAWGFVAPNVRSRAEAELVVAAAKYPPNGVRSLGIGRHHLSFKTDPATYYQRANDEIVVVLQIEHIDGVRKIDDILSVPGVDACYIGPNDLCASMGLAPSLEPSHREFEDAIQTTKRSALKHGVAPGIHCATVETLNRRVADGWRFMGILGDVRFMTAAAKVARDAIGVE
ncbi:MAG: 2-dehydro-3-deoxyglucarate aldolase [Candidatus Rokubacteria bacterium]|nr:2-dehydro-3-deoxyglucarate aldolase [Candidatus Rokubacteria bacterium]